MTIGQRIKAARKKVGMTQSELAKKLEIPYQSIGQWENDKRNPKVETIERIAAALGVHAFDLMGLGNQLDPYVHGLDGIEIEIPGITDPIEKKKAEQQIRKKFEERTSSLHTAEMFDMLPQEEKDEFWGMLQEMAFQNDLSRLIDSEYGAGACDMLQDYVSMNETGRKAARDLVHSLTFNPAHKKQEEVLKNA